jgi:hypothetical protein
LNIDLLFLDDIIVVADDILSCDLIVNGIFDKLLINLLISLVFHDLLHVLHDVREFFKDALESLPVILEGRHIGLSDEVLFDESLL